MKMSMGQIGRRLLGLAVFGAAVLTGGAAFAEMGQPARVPARPGKFPLGLLFDAEFAGYPAFLVFPLGLDNDFRCSVGAGSTH